MIKNPLSKSGLFATPRDDDELSTYIENLSGAEKALAYTISGMTWNCAVRNLDEVIDQVDIELDTTNDVLWVTVGNISVRIVRSDEGAVCDMYTKGVEDLDDAHLSGCYAFFDESVLEEGDDDVSGYPV